VEAPLTRTTAAESAAPGGAAPGGAGPLRNGQVSFWHASLGALPPRQPLEQPTSADVCIIGAGYTGLWTAWALRHAEPTLRVVVLERDHVGFGASGRNGGWLSGLLPGDPDRLARGPGGRGGVIALRRALEAGVDEVLEICRSEGIDVDGDKAGTLAVATGPAQLARLRAELVRARSWDLGPDDLRELTATELAELVSVEGAVGGLWSPHCARIHPAKLVRGLADLATRAGAEIYERSPALALSPGRVDTLVGAVRTRWIVRATEGYTAGLPGLARTLLPMNSSMIVTEPLDATTWQELGWSRPVTLRTADHAYLYAQRTADGRIALGGRGVPYRWRSGTDYRGETHASTVAALTAALRTLWPPASDAAIEHAWCGVLGVARDWCPSVGIDAASRIGWAGGYVGDGVTTAYLAGRTLADLITGAATSRVGLPWVNRRARPWEPEPLRWLGARGLYAVYRSADQAEARRGRPSRLAQLADRVAGR
jgi:glycine/D-amino acid oxidase-like deaminating enzyme